LQALILFQFLDSFLLTFLLGHKEVNGEESENQKASAEESGSRAADSPQTEALNGKEASYKLYCEKCKAIQKTHGSELVTPRRISRGRLQVQLEADVSYECSATGLVFEATEPVLVRYSILSWSKFAGFLGNSWKFAGPIFNVETVKKDASVLKSIQFPHCVCLAHPENEMTFGILHVKGNRPLIEPTVDHSGSHVKWNVTSLSPVGPIIQTPQPVDRHGVVLVYKQLGSSPHNYSFHIYLATNSASDIKVIVSTTLIRSQGSGQSQTERGAAAHQKKKTTLKNLDGRIIQVTSTVFFSLNYLSVIFSNEGLSSIRLKLKLSS
uniref:Si:dkeyp-97b10.3 n=1 Tax=Oryzias sinensis TaxID=183150 RepID=A0A8C7Y7G4_9TELE